MGKWYQEEVAGDRYIFDASGPHAFGTPQGAPVFVIRGEEGEEEAEKACVAHNAGLGSEAFRDAVIEALMVAEIYQASDEEDPKGALNRLIVHEAGVKAYRLEEADEPTVLSAEALLELHGFRKCPTGLWKPPVNEKIGKLWYRVFDLEDRQAMALARLEPGEAPCECCRPDGSSRCENAQLCDKAGAAYGWGKRVRLYEKVRGILTAEGGAS